MNIPSDWEPQPWSMHEKLELLTEIIKSANVPPDVLMPLVRSLPQPAWLHIPLPRGRSLHQCQMAYDDMLQPPTPMQGLVRSASLREGPRLPDPTGSSKRPHSMIITPTPSLSLPQYQDIQAKPTTASGLAGAVRLPSFTDEPPKKRRGRPPKAETELRRATVQARANLQALQPLQPLQPRHAPSHLSPLLPSPTSTAAQAAQAVMVPALLQSAYSTASTADQLDAEKRRARLDSLENRRVPKDEDEEEEEEPTQAQSARESQSQSSNRSPARGYPDILSQDPLAGPSSFRAPRGGNT